MEENLPKSSSQCVHCGCKEKKTLKLILFEVVLLASVVGFIPNLLMGGLEDLYGVCGFTADVCNAIQLQGAIKLVLFVFCAILAVVLGFVISKEFGDSKE